MYQRSSGTFWTFVGGTNDNVIFKLTAVV